MRPGAVYEGYLFDPLPNSLRARVDLLLANAPYVPTSEIDLMPPEAREHEHAIALDGGVDGLDLHRRVIAGAPTWLAPGGRLLIELSGEQASAAATLMIAAGLEVESHVDDHDDDSSTVLVGRRPI